MLPSTIYGSSDVLEYSDEVLTKTGQNGQGHAPASVVAEPVAEVRVTVKPLDRKAPGSRGERRRIIDLIRRSRALKSGPDTVDDGLAIEAEQESIIRRHCRFDLAPGQTEQDALDALSAEQYDRMFDAILGGESAVDPTTPTPSTTGP